MKTKGKRERAPAATLERPGCGGLRRGANNAGRVSEAAKQVHEAGGSGRTSVEGSDDAAVVA